jgi:hypothetical protein
VVLSRQKNQSKLTGPRFEQPGNHVNADVAQYCGRRMHAAVQRWRHLLPPTARLACESSDNLITRLQRTGQAKVPVSLLMFEILAHADR